MSFARRRCHDELIKSRRNALRQRDNRETKKTNTVKKLTHYHNYDDDLSLHATASMDCASDFESCSLLEIILKLDFVQIGIILISRFEIRVFFIFGQLKKERSSSEVQ